MISDVLLPNTPRASCVVVVVVIVVDDLRRGQAGEWRILGYQGPCRTKTTGR